LAHRHQKSGFYALDLLLLADLHYVHEAEHVCPIPERRTELGLALVRQAYTHLQERGVDPDMILLLGDLVDNGEARGAEKDLAAVAAQAQAWDLPVLAIPGNHDGEPGRFARLYGCAPGLHAIGGYGFLVYHDPVGEGHVTARTEADLGLAERVAAERPELHLVALQHNPLHPPIAHDYPFLLTNAEAVLAAYGRAGVFLSLSGHYHPGQAAHDAGGVTCYTAPAACEAPFRFAHVRIEGREAAVCEYALGTVAQRRKA